MANEEHLRILNQGVETWNVWRQDNPETKPNLVGAYLDNALLEGVHLDGACLQESSLRSARLAGASLIGASLNQARLDKVLLEDARLDDAFLCRANLDETRASRSRWDGARLDRANFRDAKLVEASLCRTRLRHVCFDGADLFCAVVNDAEMGETSFGGIDLSAITGLATVTHHCPSNIATNTLDLTVEGLSEESLTRRGEVESFLRGAGLENHWIVQLLGRIHLPVRMRLPVTAGPYRW